MQIQFFYDSTALTHYGTLSAVSAQFVRCSMWFPKGFNVPLIAFSIISLVGCSDGTSKDKSFLPNYPATARVDSITSFFGHEVVDPYRWLEELYSSKSKAWVEAQNQVTNSYLEQIPYRSEIRARLTELWRSPTIGRPITAGDYVFFVKNDGKQNQGVIYRQRGNKGEAEVFLDPNMLSVDGVVSARILSVSHDNRYLAMRFGKSGSDWITIRVFEVATGKQLPDEINWAKFSHATWYRDGFFYSRFPEPTPKDDPGGGATGHTVYYHKLGTPQSADERVFPEVGSSNQFVFADITQDQSFLILYASPGTYGSEVFIKDLRKAGSDIQQLVYADNADGVKTYHEYTVIEHDRESFLVLTDLDAPNNRLVRINLGKPSPEHWEDVIPESSNPLTFVGIAGKKLFAHYLKNVTSQVIQYSYDGRQERVIALPALGNATGFIGHQDAREVYYSFTSFTHPLTHYVFDISSGRSAEFSHAEISFDPDAYETKQVKYPSKDGTLIPMFIVHKKGLRLNGKNPTLLEGYGGFNIAQAPRFSVEHMLLLENGCVYALANLRGGGEFGEAWHKAGILENKQNVFDDFIAAAEYLVQARYTNPDKLAISGAANGGLLVGAAMTQRPDLFAVAIPRAGVLDMLRYHLFSVGGFWVVEYGRADSTLAQFETLKGYSPLHNLRNNTSYPATLVTTADHNDRVSPAHSYKFAAQLQSVQRGQNPVLIRIETRSGTGKGTPVSVLIEEWTDILSFMLFNLDVQKLKQTQGE